MLLRYSSKYITTFNKMPKTFAQTGIHHGRRHVGGRVGNRPPWKKISPPWKY